MGRPRKPRTLAEWIAAQRLSQRDAAGRLGMSPAQLNRILRGRRGLPSKHWVRLARVTGLPVEAFMPADVVAAVGEP